MYMYVTLGMRLYVRVQVDIPKGYSSERFLFQSAIIPRSFILKTSYSEKYLSRRVVILKFRKIVTLQDKNVQNNDPSG